jgi:hypothetical protein
LTNVGDEPPGSGGEQDYQEERKTEEQGGGAEDAVPDVSARFQRSDISGHAGIATRRQA